jgi:cellulose synthase/poly-beta-1,6-N-acetylglucosamine synthase-like glycosyltransferase
MLVYIISFISIYITVLFFLTLFEFKPYLKNPIPSRYPRVSIIVPAYNEEKGISGTVDSLLDMDYQDKEIILINDGSKDDTLKIMREYAKKYPTLIRVLDKLNSGKSDSLNQGLDLCTGELIGVLDADAFVLKDTLKKMVGYFDHEKTMAVTPSIKIWNPKTILERIQYVEFLTSSYMRKVLSFLGAVPIAPGCFTIFRREFLDKYGGWDTSTITEDIELSLRIESKRFFVENAIDANVYTQGVKDFDVLKRQRLRWYRGLIDNMVKHKELFHPSYGNLAVFILPGTILSAFLTIFATAVSLFLVGQRTYLFLSDMVLYNFDILLWWDYKFDPFFISITPYILFIGLIFILGIFVIYLSKSYSEEKQSTRYSLPFFFALYSILFTYWWSLALFYLARNKKIRWGAISG